MVHVPLIFLAEWGEFPSAPCLAWKKKLDDSSRLVVVEIARVAWHASFETLNKKRLEIRHINNPPLSKDTIDSVLRHKKLGRAKDLSAPHVQWIRHCVHCSTAMTLPLCMYSVVSGMFRPLLDHDEGKTSSGTKIWITSNFLPQTWNAKFITRALFLFSLLTAPFFFFLLLLRRPVPCERELIWTRNFYGRS